MKRFLIAFLTTGALLAATDGASAGTATTTFQVSATVLTNCLVSANPLAFGNYAPGGGNLAVNTTLSVKCTNGTPFTISLNKGSTAGGTFAQRLMANGANTLQYNLYTTAGLTTVWGDGTASTSTVAGTGTGLLTPISETVFGSLPDNAANQAAPPSGTAYTDTITVSVAF